jgi:hypothetical protein
MKGPEAIIKQKIRKWLEQQGAYVFSPVQMGFGKQTLDLLVCWRGRFIAIEVKAPGKNPTKRQELIINEIRRSGGGAFVARSLEDAHAALS